MRVILADLNSKNKTGCLKIIAMFILFSVAISLFLTFGSFLAALASLIFFVFLFIPDAIKNDFINSHKTPFKIISIAISIIFFIIQCVIINNINNTNKIADSIKITTNEVSTESTKETEIKTQINKDDFIATDTQIYAVILLSEKSANILNEGIQLMAKALHWN